MRKLREINEAYPSRSGVEEEQAIKILTDKLNDPERLNWTARFNKSYAVCDVAVPFPNITEWRTVLTEMFVSIHSDITEMQTVIRCTITGNIHTKHVASTNAVKAENINKPTNKTLTPAFYCTLCGKAYHDAAKCRAKDSIYAN